MYKNRKILGIITARGGSKGVPGKNIKPLLGKPLIVHSIEAARKSGILDRLILSTDDEKIIEVAKKYDCEIPFVRPAYLASDTASSPAVVKHAVQWLKDNENYLPDYVALLQPTSPLRQPFHIQESADLILKTGADMVLSVAEIPENFSPYKAMVLNEKGMLRLFNGKHVKERISRRQDMPKTYWSVGSIYLFKTELLFASEEPNFFGDNIAPYYIDKKYVVDINVPEDWEEAEQAMRKLTNGN
ncbi:MAG: acylneuraminate cytidylyltransferase family protein [Patescibacteria group bacterium]